MDTLVEVAELLLQATPGEDILRRLGPARVQEAVNVGSEFRRLEERGYLEKLSNRYSHLRQYLPAFFRLPFQARPGAGPLQAAIELVRRLDAGELRSLPADTPIDFVPAGWRTMLVAEDGTLDRRVWELALADAVRESLRSGDLFLPQSRRHVSFSNMTYDDQQWAADRDTAYLELSLPTAPEGALGRLRREYDEVADRTERGLPCNDFASVCDGKLRLKKTDALPVSERVERLRRILSSRFPQVRIERMLEDVDLMCGFTRAFRPLPGYPSRNQPLYGALLAALVAQGTNLGLMAMGQSAEGITPEMLQPVMQWFVREETIRAANTIMVNFPCLSG